MTPSRLEQSNIILSPITLGCNTFGLSTDFSLAQDIVGKALDMGVNTFDTAEHYGDGESEKYLGQLLGNHRKDVNISTKFGLGLNPNGSMFAQEGRGRPEYIGKALEGSLKRLNTDYIDLYNYHRLDPDVPIEDTMGALDKFVREGKIRSIAYTDLPTWKAVEGNLIAKANNFAGFATGQFEYSLTNRVVEKENVEMLLAYGMRMMPYFPLAAGLLSGKYEKGKELPGGSRLAVNERHLDRFFTDANWNKVVACQAIARESGIPLLQLAIGWLLSKPVVASIISGVSSVNQLVSNVEASRVKTPADVLKALDDVK